MPTICPVCQSSTEVVRVITAESAARHFVTPKVDSERFNRLVERIHLLWNLESATIRQCDNCKFRFCDPLIGGDGEFYRAAYDRTGGYPRDKWDYTRTVQSLGWRRLHTVVEVGAGPGFFLEKISRQSADLIAFEYDDKSIKQLETMGARVYRGDFRGKEFRDIADAVFMFQVLEHMTDPIGAVQWAAAALKGGGDLYITVPNSAATQFQEKSGSLLDMPPNHVTTWTVEAFKRVAERAGLEIQAIEIEPFSMRRHIKQDIVYSFLKRAQCDRTFEATVRATRNRALMGFTAGILSPRRLHWWALALRHRHGKTIWAHFRKPGATKT